jgi:AcrR family transcriptional regulator
MSTPPREKSLDDHFERLGLRERKKLKTRRAIQDHALRLFTEQGYDATTVEQIAEAAEISPSTFFRYFPTKEDVVVTDEYDPIMAEVFRAQPPELSPVEAMRRMFRQVLEHAYASDRDMIIARLRLVLSVPALRARAFDTNLTYRIFVELVSERVGRPRDDFEVQIFGQAVLGALEAVMIRWVENGAVEDLPGLVDRALEFVAAGCPLDHPPRTSA